MANVKQVEVGGVTVNIGQASATDQYDLYLLVGPAVDRCYKEVDDEPVIDIRVLKSLFLYAGDTIKRAASLALSKSFVAGVTTPVSVKDFAGNVDSYHELICLAIRENLADFFTRLDAERDERLEEMKAMQEAMKVSTGI